MAEVHSQAASSAKDNVLFGLAVACVLAGIVAFYWFEEMNLLVRSAMVVGGIAASIALVWASSYGHGLVAFAQASRIELRKVVWPTREETLQTTLIVFVFTAIMGVFFFGLDWALTWATRFMGGQ